ncbi:putative capsid protein [Rosellinia necatrix victorivirus 1]|uniref:Putative capsid protein n=1 Tax=Rosellinia necatrix victorivirus 1 TaxID=1148491 RepID=A0A060N644_9VIRU|nr:putative capsid protein [Rosellinia necatrix victorivirus 1]BAN51774.1 putative capsid protein [Rosellinia necatrix victorivirus 1]
MAATARNNFLASVVANARGQPITAAGHRRFRSVVRTSATIGGVNDSRAASIFYEIGRGVNSSESALAVPTDATMRVEAAYPTNAVLAEDFVGLAKKYSNFSSTFEYSSLAGVAERLARALAARSIWDDFDSTAITGGRTVVVHALGTYDGPVNSMTDTVFIPRLTNTNVRGDVFAVLVAAVTGEGSAVATDVLEVDAVTRQAVVPVVDGVALPLALVDALRIIGANMIASDQGPLFALAVTRGIHRILSVVGHTDEGGTTRDLLRCAAFSPPFGGVSSRLSDYAGLPALSTNGVSVVASYVDSIALVTAALVAHSDPGDHYQGEWFPTFFLGATPTDGDARPGQHTAGTAAMAGAIRAQLLNDQERFWQNYCRGLGMIFCAEGASDLAVRFSVTASYSLGADCRHLRHASVAPWFWIEPTSLLPSTLLGTEAESIGHASFGGRDSQSLLPAWEAIVPAGGRDTTFSAYHVRLPSARRAAMLTHWLGHELNGLGALSIRQLDPTTVVHPGACAAHPDVRDRVEAALPITDYLWTRGQSPFPAPGEFLNLGATAGIFVRHATFTDDGDITMTHLPAAREMVNCAITIEVGRPLSIANGATNAADATARRARTRGARELVAVKQRAALFGVADMAEMPVMTSAPRLDRAPPPPPPGAPAAGHGTGPGLMRPPQQGVGAGPGTNEPAGNALVPVGHHGATTAPPAPRPAGPLGAMGGGGAPGGRAPPGGAPPPPPAGGPADDNNDDDLRPAPPVAVAAAPAERAAEQ